MSASKAAANSPIVATLATTAMAQEQGTIEAEEEQMIGGVLELSEQRAHEVMVARVDMVTLEADASLAEINPFIFTDEGVGTLIRRR